MSNRGQCPRVAMTHSKPLPGGQYARGWGRSLSPVKGNRCGSVGAYFVLPTAAILFSGGLEGPAWQDWELRHRAAGKTRLEQRPMTKGPRRNAS